MLTILILNVLFFHDLSPRKPLLFLNKENLTVYRDENSCSYYDKSVFINFGLISTEYLQSQLKCYILFSFPRKDNWRTVFKTQCKKDLGK